MQKLTESFLFVILLLISIQTDGKTIINQSIIQSVNDYPPDGFGQSFTAEDNYYISAIELYISASNGGSDATISFYDFSSSPLSLGSTLLGKGEFLESDISSSANWITIELESPFYVMSGQEYAFEIIAKDSGGPSGWNNYGFSNASPYANGTRLNTSSRLSIVETSDLAFRIVAIPEPSGFSLLILCACSLVMRDSLRLK